MVLDDATKSILKIANGKILQGENGSISSYGANHMIQVGTNIVLLSTETQLADKMITALSISTLEQQEVSFEDSGVTIMENYDNLSYYVSDNTLHVLLYSLTSIGGVESMLYFTVLSTIDSVSVSNIYFRCDQASSYMRGTATSIITDKKKWPADDILIPEPSVWLHQRSPDGVL